MKHTVLVFEADDVTLICEATGEDKTSAEKKARRLLRAKKLTVKDFERQGEVQASSDPLDGTVEHWLPVGKVDPDDPTVMTLPATPGHLEAIFGKENLAKGRVSLYPQHDPKDPYQGIL